MLLINARVRPCRARAVFSSLGRPTVTVPSSRRTSIGSTTVCDSSPLGPLTVTLWPSIFTSTPLGTGIGRRPIRDILCSPPSPDVGEDFPAHAALAGLLVGHEAGRRRDDRDAEAAEDLWQVVLLRVHPETRLGHSLESGDRTLPGRPELQVDHEVLADLGVLHVPG